jgi:hypothetical protein
MIGPPLQTIVIARFEGALSATGVLAVVLRHSSDHGAP